MNKKNLWILLVVPLMMTACSKHFYYQKQSWSRMGFDQALAECKHEASIGGSTVGLCLDAKGWHHVPNCQAGSNCRSIEIQLGANPKVH